MKVNSQNIEEETNESLEASYFVEPGYVKQMIDRFSSGLHNDNTNGLKSDEEGVIFKLPLLHSTKTKTYEPFQYPILLANRSSIPVKTVLNTSGRKKPSGSSVNSTGSVGSGGSIYNINNNTNKNTSNSCDMSNNKINKSFINTQISDNKKNSCKNSIDVGINDLSRENSPCKLYTSPTHTFNSSLHTQNSSLHTKDLSSQNSLNHIQNSPSFIKNSPKLTHNSPSDLQKNISNTNKTIKSKGMEDNHTSSPPSPLSSHPNYPTLNNTCNKEFILNNLDSNNQPKVSININENSLHLENVKSGNDLEETEDSSLKDVSNRIKNGNENSKQHKDGHYFLSLMAQNGEEMFSMCQQYQPHLDQPSISEVVQGKIRAAIGKANLLLTKKFKQFTDLCATNLNASKEEKFEVTSEDLGGFWDMMLIQIDDVRSSFQELHAIKLNHWQDIPPLQTSPLQSPTSKHPARFEDLLTPTTKTPSKNNPNRSNKSCKAKKGRSSALQAAILAGRRQRKTSQTEEVVIFVADKTH